MGGFGWVSRLCSVWCPVSVGRLGTKAQMLFRPLLISHWPEQVTWRRPESKDGEGLPLDGRGCGHIGKGCAPRMGGRSRGRVTLRRGLREEAGCSSLPCLDKPDEKQRARAPLRWSGASRGAGMPLAFRWALVRLPQTL